ncbi:hypothetical protein FQZ97_996340 [compost metagenome]
MILLALMYRAATKLIYQSCAVEAGNGALDGLVHVALGEQGDLAVNIAFENGCLAQFLSHRQPVGALQILILPMSRF